MKKEEIIAQLNEKFTKVNDPVVVADVNGVKTYDVTVLEVVDNQGIQKTVSFYVNDEGSENEEAYLRQKLEEVNTFKTDLETFLETMEQDAKVVKTTAIGINEEKKYAEVLGYILEGGNVTKKNYFVFQNPDSSFTFYQLV